MLMVRFYFILFFFTSVLHLLG